MLKPFYRIFDLTDQNQVDDIYKLRELRHPDAQGDLIEFETEQEAVDFISSDPRQSYTYYFILKYYRWSVE